MESWKIKNSMKYQTKLEKQPKIILLAFLHGDKSLGRSS